MHHAEWWMWYDRMACGCIHRIRNACAATVFSRIGRQTNVRFYSNIFQPHQKNVMRRVELNVTNNSYSQMHTKVNTQRTIVCIHFDNRSFACAFNSLLSNHTRDCDKIAGCRSMEASREYLRKLSTFMRTNRRFMRTNCDETSFRCCVGWEWRRTVVFFCVVVSCRLCRWFEPYVLRVAYAIGSHMLAYIMSVVYVGRRSHAACVLRTNSIEAHAGSTLCVDLCVNLSTPRIRNKLWASWMAFLANIIITSAMCQLHRRQTGCELVGGRHLQRSIVCVLHYIHNRIIAPRVSLARSIGFCSFHDRSGTQCDVRKWRQTLNYWWGSAEWRLKWLRMMVFFANAFV